MRGLRSRIMADIEEVNHEIRVGLGLEEPIAGLSMVDTVNDTPDDTTECPIDDEQGVDEPEVLRAFGQVLDKLWAKYERERAAIWGEPDGMKTRDEIPAEELAE